MQPRDGSEWQAGYKLEVRMAQGSKPGFVQIEGVKSAECPRSIMLRNPEFESLIQMHTQEQTLKGLGDPGKWPGAMFDAFLVLSEQQEIDKYAREEAIRNVS